jgi:hypothetical protein
MSNPARTVGTRRNERAAKVVVMMGSEKTGSAGSDIRRDVPPSSFHLMDWVRADDEAGEWQKRARGGQRGAHSARRIRNARPARRTRQECREEHGNEVHGGCTGFPFILI